MTVAWLSVLALLGGGFSTRPAELIASVIAIATVMAIAVAAHVATHPRCVGVRPSVTSGAALRERARRTGVLRQRDPDAQGRRRPRAPSALPSAA